MSGLPETKRKAIVSIWDMLIAWGPKRIGYVYGGGADEMYLSVADMKKRFDKGLGWAPDCEHVVNWVCRRAGWSAPGGKYGWYASSGEMWDVRQHFTDVREASLGTIIVWGPEGRTHVTQVIGEAGTANPILGSHGSAFSSNRVSYLAEAAYHEARGDYPTMLVVGDLE